MAEKQSPGNNRGHYTVYTPEQKAEIGRYAAEHGNLKAVCSKFTEQFGIEVKESTVRQFKKAYFIQLNEGKNPDQITAIRGKKRGRPSKAGLPSTPTKTAGSPVAVVSNNTSSVSIGDATTPEVAAVGIPAVGIPAVGVSAVGVPTVGVPAVSVAAVGVPGVVVGEYEQMVGEMAISSCITDLMNGDTSKPLVLVASCSDGKQEVQELSTIADVRTYTDIRDLSQLPEEVCMKVSYAIVGMSCPVDRGFIDRCPKLRVIVTLGSSCDSIDVDYAGQMGIVVSNTPDLCIEEVADSAFSFVLSFYRQTPFLHTAVQQGKHLLKQEDIYSGARQCRRIRGKTLGLLGLGKTGIALAQRAKAFGFNVIFYDPSTADGLEKAIGGLERVSLIADLLTKSDCISLHCSLSDESRHIINENTLRLFKRGAFLINVTHRQLIDEVALAKALRYGKLGGAALDVSDSSACDEKPLKGCPNFIATPHVAWYSKESYAEVRGAAIRLVHQALTTLDGLNMNNCVNAQQLDVDLCRVRWTTTS